jgi:hypothetical protein
MARLYVGVRMAPDGLAVVDRLAKDRKLDRSKAIRLLIAYAIRHMPEGWKP